MNKPDEMKMTKIEQLDSVIKILEESYNGGVLELHTGQLDSRLLIKLLKEYREALTMFEDYMYHNEQ